MPEMSAVEMDGDPMFPRGRGDSLDLLEESYRRDRFVAHHTIFLKQRIRIVIEPCCPVLASETCNLEPLGRKERSRDWRYGIQLNERSLVPDKDARLGETRFEDWLIQATKQAPKAGLQGA